MNLSETAPAVRHQKAEKVSQHIIGPVAFATDPSIEKVFHNSEYDINYLGSAVATNVTCTFKMAKSIPRHRFSPPERLSLKSPAENFGVTVHKFRLVFEN